MDDERTYYPMPYIDNNSLSTGVSRTVRDVPPADYLLKIDSFSLLSNIVFEGGEKNYMSNSFEVDGCKWRLSLYPEGDTKRDGGGYLSLYLVMADTEAMPNGFEVNVNFKLFVYDQNRDKYLTVQDTDGRVRRFHKLKTEHGFAQFVSLAAFNDESNGYLVDDSCVFGVEIFVIKNKRKGECLSIAKEPNFRIHTWRVKNLSKLNGVIYSHEFSAGGRKWKLGLWPRGDKLGSGENLGLHLFLVDYFVFPNYIVGWPTYIPRWLQRNNSTISPKERKVYVECVIRVMDQVNHQHMENTVKAWFSTTADAFGYWDFMPLATLKDGSNGFLLNDTLIVQAMFEVIFVDTSFT